MGRKETHTAYTPNYFVSKLASRHCQNTYIHTYVHTYISKHTYVHTYISKHTYYIMHLQFLENTGTFALSQVNECISDGITLLLTTGSHTSAQNTTLCDNHYTEREYPCAAGQ